MQLRGQKQDRGRMAGLPYTYLSITSSLAAEQPLQNLIWLLEMQKQDLEEAPRPFSTLNWS